MTPRQSCVITPERFKKLFEKHFDDVTSFLYMYASSNAELKDWVQDVFVKLWEKREQIDFDHPSFKSYLLKTARNHALKKLQRTKKYNAWLEENLKKLIDLQAPASLLKKQVSEEIRTAYNNVISKLPPRAQETWILSREEGLSYPEIAENMGVSVKTVETQISKVLKTLRKELGNIEY